MSVPPDLARLERRFNESVRLASNTLNAIALGIAGLAVLTPLLRDQQTLGDLSVWPLVIAVVLHGLAHYILSLMR